MSEWRLQFSFRCCLFFVFSMPCKLLKSARLLLRQRVSAATAASVALPALLLLYSEYLVQP